MLFLGRQQPEYPALARGQIAGVRRLLYRITSYNVCYTKLLRMDEVYFGLAPLLTSMFDASEIHIFTIDKEKKELFSRFNSPEGIQEIRLPLTNENPIGLVALGKKVINLRNAGDADELKRVHAGLTLEGRNNFV